MPSDAPNESEVEIVLHQVEEHGHTFWQTTDGKYKIWFNDRFVHPYRWSRKDWKDDGVGLHHHGGARSLEDAAVACLQHQALYESV